jgi:hypothetical protein
MKPILAAAAILTATAATAADLPMPAQEVVIESVGVPQWSFAVAPYLWAAGISGDVAQFGLPEVEIDASFSDILENLDFAAMLVAELRHGRFGFFGDLMYVKISGSAGTPAGLLADSASLDTQSLAVTAAPEFRILDTAGASLDVLAGARVWSVDTDVAFAGGPLAGVSGSDGDTWVDPLVGLKGRLDLGDRFYLSAWTMAGGFGVSSDFMWDAWGGLGYEFNNHISAILGYRGTGVDYENDGFVYDVIQHGPIIGAAIRF